MKKSEDRQLAPTAASKSATLRGYLSIDGHAAGP